jgi:nitrite reductase/ring-hydroxylating ferredoxin subunit
VTARPLLVQPEGHVPVVLARLSDGTAVAFATTCPHEGNPLAESHLWNDLVDCAYHHYTYDPRNGRNVYPRSVFPAERAAALKPLPIYAVREADGFVWVGERIRPAAGPAPEREDLSTP